MLGTLPGQNTSSSMTESRETESADCPVCLEAFTFDRPVTTTICNHTFHERCLNISFKYDNRCPMCRTILAERVITLNHLANNLLNLAPGMTRYQEMTTQGRSDAARELSSGETSLPTGVPSIFNNMTSQQFADCVRALVQEPQM